MKRKAISGIVLMLLLTSMLSSALIIQPVKAAGGTIYIRPDGSVDPPTAPILNVGNIYYTFTDDIYDSIVVQRSNIIIDGAGHTLQGSGSGKGFHWRGPVKNVTIKNTIIKGGTTGIVIGSSSSHNTIFGNDILNNDNGLWLEGTSYINISGNVIRNNDIGAVLFCSSNSLLKNNQMIGNRYNFGVEGLELSHFIHNVDSSNKVDGKPIYYWVNRHNETVPSDAGYIALVNSSNITVKGQELKNNREGILLAYTTNSKIMSNNVTDNQYGIVLVSSDGVIVSGNSVTNNTFYGISLRHSNNSIVFGNNIKGSSTGLLMLYSFYNTVSGNNLINRWGVGIQESADNVISGNKITGGIDGYPIGVWFYKSHSNNVNGNDIKKNKYGVYLSRSLDNKFYHNNFINNIYQVFDAAKEYSWVPASVNIWDDGYPSGGNYWSDYEERYPDAEELDGSGIWDTPYVIDENNQDNYPLMNPWTPTPPKPSPVYGKGIWITYIWEIESGDLSKIIERLKSTKVKWVAIKCGDGDSYWLSEGRKLFEWAKNYGGFSEVIKRFHDNGIRVLGAHFVYGYDRWEIFDVSEVDVSNEILDIEGIDGLLINAENDTESGIRSYKEYLESLRNMHRNSFIAYTSFARSDGYREDLHRLFTEYSDVSMPQAYWAARPLPPEEEIGRMEQDLGELRDKWHNKPIMPMGQGGKIKIGDVYSRDVNPSEITRFCESLFKKGYIGVSLFEYEIMQDDWKWEEYSKCFNDDITITAYSPVDLVITDPNGLTISNVLNEISGATYVEFDINGDGNPDDKVTILHRKLGNYSIEVTAEPGATPTDTFTLEVFTRTETIVLAEDVPVSEIPSEPYIFESTDETPPETWLNIGEPKFVAVDTIYLTLATPIALIAEDNPGGSGVALTSYQIYNATYDSGWIIYTQPFYLIGLSDGTYHIDYNSTDNAGNIEPTNTATLVLDNSPPTLTIETPLEDEALQDEITFTASAWDLSKVASVMFSIREPDGEQGKIISSAFESMPATLSEDGRWKLVFDTTQLPDGYYLVVVESTDVLGNTGYTAVSFSIRNWATIELLPASESNKAGRTMPVKFSLRIATSVDPNQPFVRNEELTIIIFEKDNQENILQNSTYGTTSRDYRIDDLNELYITNFKTLKTPTTYVVEIYRKGMLIGTFEFSTVM